MINIISVFDERSVDRLIVSALYRKTISLDILPTNDFICYAPSVLWPRSLASDRTSSDHNSFALNVTADNEMAIALYQKLGFEVIGTYGEFMIEVKWPWELKRLLVRWKTCSITLARMVGYIEKTPFNSFADKVKQRLGRPILTLEENKDEVLRCWE